MKMNRRVQGRQQGRPQQSTYAHANPQFVASGFINNYTASSSVAAAAAAASSAAAAAAASAAQPNKKQQQAHRNATPIGATPYDNVSQVAHNDIADDDDEDDYDGAGDDGDFGGDVVNAMDDDAGGQLVNEAQWTQPRKPWFREGNVKKKPSVRQKRIKRNRSLRKLLTPKNALMALYELKGNELSEFQMQSDEKGFVATVSVNGKDFSGRGISKMAAKNDASEKALRDFIIAKMQTIPRGSGGPTHPNGGSGGASNDDGDGNGGGSGDEQEEVPMMHLASFALHKLFTEWQSEGFEIPDFRAGPVSVVRVETPKPTERKELPPNHVQLHPSMLLAIMRPQTQYIELGSEGITPNVIHRIGVTVDGHEFIGAARSKKAARKSAAIQACNTVFKCAYLSEVAAVAAAVGAAETAKKSADLAMVVTA